MPVSDSKSRWRGMSAPFDPEEYFRFAREIAATSQSEAALRSAVSRAYYAVFLLARERMDVRVTARAHESVIRRLAEDGHVFLASLLGTIRSFRELADYSLAPDRPDHQSWEETWLRVERHVAHLIRELRRLP